MLILCDFKVDYMLNKCARTKSTIELDFYFVCFCYGLTLFLKSLNFKISQSHYKVKDDNTINLSINEYMGNHIKESDLTHIRNIKSLHAG